MYYIPVYEEKRKVTIIACLELSYFVRVNPFLVTVFTLNTQVWFDSNLWVTPLSVRFGELTVVEIHVHYLWTVALQISRANLLLTKCTTISKGDYCTCKNLIIHATSTCFSYSFLSVYLYVFFTAESHNHDNWRFKSTSVTTISYVIGNWVNRCIQHNRWNLDGFENIFIIVQFLG